MVDFLCKWQTLIGAALGPFLLGVGFYIKNIIVNHKEYRESLRRIEISTTRSIDSFIKSQVQLKENIKRIKELVSKIQTENKNEFSLDRINFSIIREIYRDDEIPNFKIKSYYLHNKLLWVDAGIKELNEINRNFREDFKDLVRTNDLLVSLMKENKVSDPEIRKIYYANQHASYIDNLMAFVGGVEKYIVDISENIKFIIQSNIYNNHLRERRFKGIYFKWKNEGTRFKYFRIKKQKKEFSRNLDSMERIDKCLEKEVKEKMQGIEERTAKINEIHNS